MVKQNVKHAVGKKEKHVQNILLVALPQQNVKIPGKGKTWGKTK
jgi:hypothetical protein